jgi:hypothetical protein
MRPVCTSENCGAGTGGTLVAAFALERAYNAKIEKCQTVQDDLRFAFDAANGIHAQHNRDEYGGMIEAQTRARELMIEREEVRAERSVSEEFRQRSREWER